MTIRRHPTIFEGWNILWTMTGVVMLVVLPRVLMERAGDEAMAHAIRWTARLGFPCFLLAYSAAPARYFWNHAFTRWQVAQRRYLGVSFAVIHLLHGVVILTRSWLSDGASLAGRGVEDFVGGGLIYGFITAMLLTSFRGPASWVGPTAWQIIHGLGVNLIAIVFMGSYGPRAAESWVFWPQVSLLFLAFALRIGRFFRELRADPNAEGV